MSHLPTVVDARLEEWSPVHWAFHVWSWIVLLTLFVVLEVWADLLLASLVLCLKFGWRDLLVAMRLHSHKNRPMAVVLRRYCLALACFKVALTGILVTSAVITCQTLLGIHPQLGRFLAGYILLICGLVFGEIMVLFAATNSCHYGVHAWLDRTIYEDLFRTPAAVGCHGTRNRVPWLLVAGMFLITLTFLPAPIAAVILLVRGWIPAGIPSGVISALFWIITIRPMRAALAIAARSPQECWGRRTSPPRWRRAVYEYP